ncbi:MAG: hypothetical protein EOO24_64100, partial [Comamonadaceae bacterium]
MFLLAASGLAPLALVLLVASAYLVQERRIEAQRSALDLSRALATAVDAELDSTISLLTNLATSSDLQDIAPARVATEDFGRLSRRMAQSQQWLMIVVTDERGVPMAHEGPVPALGRPVESESMAQVRSTLAPAVGRVAVGPSGRDAFAVRIPVLKDGRLRYVLSAVVPTTRIVEVVTRQQVAAPWVASVFDQGGTRVVGSHAGGPGRYSASMENLLAAGGDEGVGIIRTAQGQDKLTGFSRVRSSQWVVAVGILADDADADLRRVIAAQVRIGVIRQ